MFSSEFLWWSNKSKRCKSCLTSLPLVYYSSFAWDIGQAFLLQLMLLTCFLGWWMCFQWSEELHMSSKLRACRWVLPSAMEHGPTRHNDELKFLLCLSWYIEHVVDGISEVGFCRANLGVLLTVLLLEPIFSQGWKSYKHWFMPTSSLQHYLNTCSQWPGRFWRRFGI